MNRPVLIIIPGLGDRGWLYRLVRPLWYILGFDARVFVFGWDDVSVSYKTKKERLLAYINAITQPVYVIGASAGGVVAVNALLGHPQRIRQIVTIATPYVVVPSLRNSVLRAAQRDAGELVRRDQVLAMRRITSFYGLYDGKVPIATSKKDGVRSMQLPMIGHGAILFCTLVFYSVRMKKIFVSDRIDI